MKKKISRALLRLHPDRVNLIPFDMQTEAYARDFTEGNLATARFRLSMVSELTPDLMRHLSLAPSLDRRSTSLLEVITREAGFKSVSETKSALSEILERMKRIKQKNIKYIDII
jgi:hypothetical protein